MHRMRSAITTAKLTGTKGERQGPRKKAENTGTVVSGFQKARFCVITWENLRGQPKAVLDPTSLTTKSHSNTANGIEKKRTKTTLSGLSVTSTQKRQKTA